MCDLAVVGDCWRAVVAERVYGPRSGARGAVASADQLCAVAGDRGRGHRVVVGCIEDPQGLRQS